MAVTRTLSLVRPQPRRLLLPSPLSASVMGSTTLHRRAPVQYRVTITLVQNLPLTSKQKFCSCLARPGQARPGQSGTFVLKATGGFEQVELSPCTRYVRARRVGFVPLLLFLPDSKMILDVVVAALHLSSSLSTSSLSGSLSLSLSLHLRHGRREGGQTGRPLPCGLIHVYITLIAAQT